MLLRTRERRRRRCATGVDTREIARTSRLVSRLTGYAVQPNKAIVGRNAFAHESGIHQDGVLKERTTYEIMDATTVGLDAQRDRARQALRPPRAAPGARGAGLRASTAQALNTAFKRFKEIADRKKQVTAMDLEALVTDELREEIAGYTLEWFEVEASSRRPPHATVAVRTPDGEELDGLVHRRRAGRRDLPRDQRRHRRSTRSCASSASTRSPAARTRSARPRVVLELDGPAASGQGVSTDIIEAGGARLRARAVATPCAKVGRGAAVAARGQLTRGPEPSGAATPVRRAPERSPAGTAAASAPPARLRSMKLPADRRRARRSSGPITSARRAPRRRRPAISAAAPPSGGPQRAQRRVRATGSGRSA